MTLSTCLGGRHMPRNPRWTKDELILALDLYYSLQFGQRSGQYGEETPEVVELSLP